MSETTLIAGSDTNGKLTRGGLASFPTPSSTATHQVIPHIEIVHALEEQLGFRHIAIASEEYAVTKDGKNFFGVPPPDLSVEARVRGADWLYAYLRGFYRDPSAATGVHFTAFPTSTFVGSGFVRPCLNIHTSPSDVPM